VWHFVGKLQSNKARRTGELFHAIHTIESESQLRELNKLATPIDALIEVNIAQEPGKSGVYVQELDAFVEKVLYCKQVRLKGLMTIGAITEDRERTRQWFRHTRELLEKIPGGTWISMGMSADFDVAIQEGATHVRIGSALFGERDRKEA
jgi:pyridoxal phosphate enzyme (YggS family)